MNYIKKILGVVFILMPPYIIYVMILEAIKKIGAASELTKTNITLQWTIILTIFIPCCVGLLIFGWYAVNGEYDELPDQSSHF